MYDRLEYIEKVKRALQNANSTLTEHVTTTGNQESFGSAMMELEDAISYETGVESKFTKYSSIDS